MKFLFDLFNIVKLIFVWGSLAFAIFTLIKMTINVQKKMNKLKSLIIANLSLAYIVLFILLKVFCNDIFDLVTSVGFWIFLIIATQQVKHEDRKAGRRWWTT